VIVLPEEPQSSTKRSSRISAVVFLIAVAAFVAFVDGILALWAFWRSYMLSNYPVLALYRYLFESLIAFCASAIGIIGAYFAFKRSNCAGTKMSVWFLMISGAIMFLGVIPTIAVDCRNYVSGALLGPIIFFIALSLIATADMKKQFQDSTR
jgi:hypothetical protein